ncbi:hypothetical protein ACU635_26220 [[Actinomadura] parvosata]|uniref:hypothetical protein n=1 Tax=[Actinomadura] parvosata TaxID=1955412 RepID=UPI00406C2683
MARRPGSELVRAAADSEEGLRLRAELGEVISRYRGDVPGEAAPDGAARVSLITEVLPEPLEEP